MISDNTIFNLGKPLMTLTLKAINNGLCFYLDGAKLVSVMFAFLPGFLLATILPQQLLSHDHFSGIYDHIVIFPSFL